MFYEISREAVFYPLPGVRVQPELPGVRGLNIILTENNALMRENKRQIRDQLRYFLKLARNYKKISENHYNLISLYCQLINHAL